MTPKENVLAKIRSNRVDLLSKHFKISKDEIDSPASDWLIVLNCSFDNGVNGQQLMEIFEIQNGFLKLEMFLGGTPCCFVQFDSIVSASSCKLALDGIYCPQINKVILLNFTTFVPQFPPRPLTHYSNLPIPGLTVMCDFISHDQESLLIEHVKNESCRWQQLGKRNVQHYSFRFDYPSKSVDRDGIPQDNSLPEWIKPILTKYHQVFPQNPYPDQLTLNHYFPGGGIAPHTDRHSSFTSPIIIFSLSSDIVMEFRKKTADGFITWFVVLPARSLCLMDGECRYGWEHVIRPRKMDLIDGLVVERKDRLSLTLRNIRTQGQCDCGYELCD